MALKISIKKRLGSFALGIDLEVDREIVVLFGPSGAGKTQTLNCVAGLTTPDEGQIAFDDLIFFRRQEGLPSVRLPSRKRNAGYVFQSYALFPHMTALQNVAYPLREKGSGIRARELIERLGLSAVAGLYPSELSGGQQQRVAIARALASRPLLLLLDEPFSALDAPLREELYHEVRQIQRELALPVLYVTHSLTDAFAVGDRLAILDRGTILQSGAIAAICAHPASERVIRILGLPNVIRGTIRGDGTEIDWKGLLLRLPGAGGSPGAEVTAMIQPEAIKIVYPGRALAAGLELNRFAGTVIEREQGPTSARLRLLLTNGEEVAVVFPRNSYAGLSLSAGSVVELAVRPEAITRV